MKTTLHLPPSTKPQLLPQTATQHGDLSNSNIRTTLKEKVAEQREGESRQTQAASSAFHQASTGPQSYQRRLMLNRSDLPTIFLQSDLRTISPYHFIRQPCSSRTSAFCRLNQTLIASGEPVLGHQNSRLRSRYQSQPPAPRRSTKSPSEETFNPHIPNFVGLALDRLIAIFLRVGVDC